MAAVDALDARRQRVDRIRTVAVHKSRTRLMSEPPNVQSLQPHQRSASDPRFGAGNARHDGQPASSSKHFPGLFGSDRAQCARRCARTHDGALGVPSPGRARSSIRASRTSAMSPRRVGGVGSASRADASCRLRAFRRTRRRRTGRIRRSGSRSTKLGLSPSSPASGRTGHPSARSRKARRRTTSTHFWRPSRMWWSRRRPHARQCERQGFGRAR